MRNAARLINEQKATVVVEHLTYSAVDEAYGVDIFTEEKLPTDSGRAVKTSHHIFDYVFTDSKNEREFVALLDSGTEIEVYAKLPKAFSIPTPVGGYTPDWRSLSSRAPSGTSTSSLKLRAQCHQWSSGK